MNSRPLWFTAYDANFVSIFGNHFLKSFRALGLDKHFDLHPYFISEEYGSYGEKKYNGSYSAELQRIIWVLQQNLNKLIVWSDVDIHLYRSPVADIEGVLYNADLSCSMDSPTVHCTGFQFFWCSQKIVNFYRQWLDLNESKEWQSPQDSYNEALKASNLLVFKLPHRYWTAGLDSGKVWDGQDIEDLPEPPKDIVLHHGNWTIGLQNKTASLDVTEQRIQKGIKEGTFV